MFENLKDYKDSEENRMIARWRGEAASIWWNGKGVSDSVRDKISKMEPYDIFCLGWLACRGYDSSKKIVNNDDPDGGEDSAGFGA